MLKKRLYEFTPIDVSRMIGVTNKTVINRCRSYRLSDFSRANEKKDSERNIVAETGCPVFDLFREHETKRELLAGIAE